jgi:antitoxin ParD1/3/4
MDTTSIQITLPPSLKEFVMAQAAEGKYDTPDEYVSALVAAERKRQAVERLETLIQEGIDSGPPIEANDEFWAKTRRELDERLRKHHSAVNE